MDPGILDIGAAGMAALSIFAPGRQLPETRVPGLLLLLIEHPKSGVHQTLGTPGNRPWPLRKGIDRSLAVTGTESRLDSAGAEGS